MGDRGQPGKFVSLEGVDGAGKSTHVAYLAERLQVARRVVHLTREPGGTRLSEQLRELILREDMAPDAEVLLMFAARADHLRQVIRPALLEGRWVVCDRFTDATIAYQGAGKGASVSWIRALAQTVHGDLWPDLTLVFDCPYEVSRSRLLGTGRALDRFESEGQAFFERVRQSYLDQAHEEPGRVRIVDANRPPAEIRAELDRILETL